MCNTVDDISEDGLADRKPEYFDGIKDGCELGCAVG